MSTTTTNGTMTTPSNIPDTTNSTDNGSTPKRSKRPLPKYKHAVAIHSKTVESVLTSGSEATPKFHGFRNLMLLVILVSNLRLMIENFNKYGVLICIRCHDYRQQDIVYGTFLFLTVPASLFVAYIIELFAAAWAKEQTGGAKKDDDAVARRHSNLWYYISVLHGVNISLNLCTASYVVYYHIHHPGIGTLCELHAIIVWLKTTSYALTNRDLRHALLTGAPKDAVPDIYGASAYPRNITLGNLSYFWWAPTLVYQPVYPRTARIRWLFVVKRAAELVGLCIAIWIASAQYAVPLLHNSVPAISHLDGLSFLERLLKLSSISLFCWLAGFFAIFQSSLNLLAELMRWGDRCFYDDWWNASNVRDYWTMWNKPVYQYMKRHVYLPLLGRRVPPALAQLIVFVLSGILHEMAVGIPTHNVIGVAFAGMMFQIPLIILTDVLNKIPGLGGETIGNVIFWITFVLVGQPVAALLYFFAWQAKYGSVTKPQLSAIWS